MNEPTTTEPSKPPDVSVPTSDPQRAATEQRAVRIFWRGLTRRCPRCGAGHLFRHYFTLVPDCPGCGLHFEREQGYFAGALAINIIVIGALFAVVFVSLLVLTIPNVPVAPILGATLPIVVLGPILYYPFSKTVWLAVDHAFLSRLDPNDRNEQRSRPATPRRLDAAGLVARRDPLQACSVHERSPDCGPVGQGQG